MKKDRHAPDTLRAPHLSASETAASMLPGSRLQKGSLILRAAAAHHQSSLSRASARQAGALPIAGETNVVHDHCPNCVACLLQLVGSTDSDDMLACTQARDEHQHAHPPCPAHQQAVARCPRSSLCKQHTIPPACHKIR
jgi:hypothetical protein